MSRHRHRHRRHVSRSTPARDPSLRISDAERDAAITRLGAQAAEGRLSSEELEHRSDTAMTASTHGELEPLFADLPADVLARAGRARRPRRDRYARGKLTLVAAGGGVWGAIALLQHMT